MGTKVPFKFQLVSYKVIGGPRFFIPLRFPRKIWFRENPEEIAELFCKKLDEHVLKKGNFSEALRYIRSYELTRKQLTVYITPKNSQQRFPHAGIELKFDYFRSKLKTGEFFGFVPILCVGVTATTEKALEKHLKNAVKQVLLREEILDNPYKILATQLLSDCELVEIPAEIEFYAPAELERLRKETSREILSNIAVKLGSDEDAAFGLEDEIQQLLKLIKGKFRSNILVVGPHGCGKTCLINELAKRISGQDIKIWATDAITLIQKLTDVGGWQQNLATLCSELRMTDDVLYVGNLYDLFQVGKYEGNPISLAEFLRSYIDKGEIRIIAECTSEEAASIDRLYPGYLSYFSVVQLTEPKREKLAQIVREKTKFLSQKYGVEVAQDAIDEAINLHQRFCPYSGYPGKILKFFEYLIANLREKHKRIDKGIVISQFCRDTGIPRFFVDPEVPFERSRVQKFFESRIMGQEEAISVIVDLLASVKAMLTKPGKPIASLFFVGPTGVGKTEMAKTLAEFMFGSARRLIRFDMSEFNSPVDVMRLTGDLWGGEGLLTSAVRKNPFSVILFDEIEKADPAIFDLLLQILGDGRLTDARGRVADFCGTIIIMTSNIGAESFKVSSLGFIQNLSLVQKAKEHFIAAVEKFFRPELFNRIDRVVVFTPLDRKVMEEIVKKEIRKIQKKPSLRMKNLTLKVDHEVISLLAEEGYDPEYGARYLQRTIREKFLVPFAKEINRFNKMFGYDSLTPLIAHVKVEEGEIGVNIEADHSKRKEIKLGQKSYSFVEFIKEVDEGRKKIYIVCESPLFRSLCDVALDVKSPGLWKKGPMSSPDVWACKKLKDTIEKLIVEIEDMNAELLFVSTGVRKLSDNIAERFQDWKERFKQSIIDLVYAVKPEYSTCIVGIYGAIDGLLKLAEIYLNIANAQGFKVKPNSVWYVKSKNTFERKDYPPGGLSQTNDNLLVGVEIEIEGKCAYLFFKDEEGVHLFKVTEKKEKERRCLVKVKLGKDRRDLLDEKIYRKHVYTRGPVRRIYGLDYVEYDGVRIKLSKGQKDSDVVRNFLREQFLTEINKLVLCDDYVVDENIFK